MIEFSSGRRLMLLTLGNTCASYLMHLCSPADALNAVKGSSLSVSPGYDSHTDGKGLVNQAEGGQY